MGVDMEATGMLATGLGDVVQRLRTRAEAKRRHRANGNVPTPTLYGSPRLDDEAADEIERLRALVGELRGIAGEACDAAGWEDPDIP